MSRVRERLAGWLASEVVFQEHGGTLVPTFDLQVADGGRLVRVRCCGMAAPAIASEARRRPLLYCPASVLGVLEEPSPADQRRPERLVTIDADVVRLEEIGSTIGGHTWADPRSRADHAED